MRVSSRGFIRILLSITASLLIGWWAYLRSGSPEYTFELRSLNWLQVPILCFLIILGGVVRSWRLGHLFHPSYGQVFKTLKTLFFSISFSFLLGGIGFLIRLFILRRVVGARHVVSLGLIGIEKSIDFFLAFTIFFFFFTVHPGENMTLIWLNENKRFILIPLLIFLIWFYFHHGQAFRFLLKCLHSLFQILSLPKKYYYFIKRQIFYLYKCLNTLPSRRFFFFIIQSLLVFTVESTFFYLGIRTVLGIEIGVEQALLLNAVVLLALLIPLLPSGIGLFQAAIVLILGDHGGNVFYASLLLHFFLIITHLFILTLGIYQFFDHFKGQSLGFYRSNQKWMKK